MMKSKQLLYGAIILLIIGVIVFFVANQKADPKNKCCEQCQYGASHDVAGYDIGKDNCLKYEEDNRFDSSGRPTNEKILTPDCVDYFNKNSLTISQCR